MVIIALAEVLFVVLRLDYLSCVLTVLSTVLIGRRNWEGWVLAGINSVIFCVIGFRTSQIGFIPANLFCIVLYAFNLRSWRKAEES
jgi:hypothetical protein